MLQIIPALGAGGAEQAVVDINAALVARGHSSLVVSSGGTRAKEITAAGGVVLDLPAASKNPAMIMRNARILARIVREQQVDLLHARSRAPAWSAWLAARATGCPFVTTFHAAYAFKNGFKKSYNRVMTRGQRIIAISDYIAAHIRDNYGVPAERIQTINRGIDLRRFDPAQVTDQRLQALRDAWHVASQTRLVLLPARLSRIKGQTVLVEALRQMAAAGKRAHLRAVIVGADQGRTGYASALLEQIVSAGLRTTVTLAEHCEDMPAAYALADVVVVPSLVPEGFGRVPVEAQAMGVPVVATDLGATRETILADETGWLVPAGDAAALAERIEQALALAPDRRVELAKRATAHVRQHFDVTDMVQKTLDLYAGLLSKSNPYLPPLEAVAQQPAV